MAAPDMLVSRIKESMRIRHDRLDGDIRGNIEAAMADMGMRGVAVPEGDALLPVCLPLKLQADPLGVQHQAVHIKDDSVDGHTTGSFPRLFIH